MTAPLGPRDDDGVVDLLRAAGHGGADATPADVTRAMAAGRRIRRRRHVAQVVGSGVAALAVIALGLAAAGAFDDEAGRTTVASAPDSVSASPASPSGVPTSDVDRLLEALGTPPWVRQGDHVVLPRGSEVDPPLPSDAYSVTGEIQFVTRAQFDAVCAKAGATPCARTEVPDRGDVYVWGYADRDDTSGAVRSERAIYFRRDDGRIVLASLSLTGTGPVSEVAPVNGWMRAWDDELIEAATDPEVSGRPGQ